MSESGAGAPQPPVESAESAEAARERRLRALRELTRPPAERGQPDGQNAAASGEQSTEQPGMVAGAAAPRPQHRRARVALWASALVALCIALIVVGAAYGGLIPGVSFKAKAPTPAISMTSHDLRDANITCFQDSAWSPKGDQLAILGYQSACSTIFQGGSSSIGSVAIYDMASNHIVTQFSPDTLIRPPANAIMQYLNILWSPDGQRLAVTFSVLTLQTLPGVSGPVLAPTSGGVLLTDTSGTRAHARTLELPAAQSNGVVSGSLAFSGEWDVTTGKVITQHINTSSAVAFQWGANGALQPLNNGASKVIGNPSGGQTFSVWQPGSAQLGVAALNNDPNTLSVIPGLYLWNTNFAAWSPDGRYLYAPPFIGKRVILPGQPAPNPQTLHTTGFDQTTTITPRDSSFTSLCLALLPYDSAANQTGVFPEVDMAWRLDGRVLAAQTLVADANGEVTPSFYTVTLYDTVTGRVLAHLSHDAHLAATADGAFGLVRWSPDGKHLALADGAFNSLTIWTFNKPLV